MNEKFNVGVGTPLKDNIIRGMEYPQKSKNEITCENLTKFLMEKNKRYGNSALEPLKVFSKIEPDNSICVRIDDKLSRIVNGKELKKNDIVVLAGYLVLLCTQNGWTDF